MWWPLSSKSYKYVQFHASRLSHKVPSNTYRWVFGGLSVLIILIATQLLLYPNNSAIADRPAFSSSPNHFGFDTEHAHIFDKVAQGRVLITGGGGNIGKPVVRRLLSSSTPVTVLDKIFHDDELEEIYHDIPWAHDLLRIIIGDIRDNDALWDAMTYDVVGVIHLAAVSRVLWCLENEPDCWDVNERGTTAVLQALTDHGRRVGIRPWFILASSREVYGKADTFPVTEDSALMPANVYGSSKLRAEQALNRHIQTIDAAGKDAGSLHAIALRLSNIYGGVYDHVERLIPSITTQALSHLPIQIVGGHQDLDMVHIDDCVDAFLLAIKRLTIRSEAWSLMATHISLETFNVASGTEVPVSTLVENLLRLTRSKSPIQRVQGDDRFPDEYIGSTEKAARVLGFRSSVSIEEGLLRLVRLYLRRTQRFLTAEIRNTCFEAAPAIKENAQLEKLDGCSSHISVDIQGRLGALYADQGRWWVEEALPPPLVTTRINRADDGRYLVRIQSGSGYFSLRGDMPSAPGEANVHDTLTENDLAAGDAVFDWELEANLEKAAVRLIAPGSNYQLAPPLSFGHNLSFVHKEAEIWPFRFTPVCCPGPSPWPFFSEDPIDQSIEYLRSSPVTHFSASGPKTLCNRMERALDKAQRDLATLSLDLIHFKAGHRTRVGPASEWVNANLPACSNLCRHPTVCLDTGDCQCVLSTCVSQRRFPFQAYAHLPILSYPGPNASVIAADRGSLVEMVKKSSWLNVLRPQASRFIGIGTAWPKVYVSPLSPGLREFRNGAGKDVEKLADHNCFSADSSMELPLRSLNVSADDADLVFMPFYDLRADRFYDESLNYIRDTINGLSSHNLIIPFAYDWGVCRIMSMDVWNVRSQSARRNPRANDVIAWSVMGDLNSPCYKPFQDVVIPPRTCVSPGLWESFSDMSNVRPARSRKTLASFKGTFWGTGTLTRRKLTCIRTPPVSPSLINLAPLTPLWDSMGDYPSYLALLNDTIFCVQPEGTTGWATRLEDSLYAGCIPVFIGSSTEYPFFDMIDWSKISIRVERKDLQRLEEVLVGYTMEEVERMQANIMLVRDAFIYPLDGKHDDQLNMRGPMFYALHATKMRLLTQYPVGDVVDRPNWLPLQ